MDRTGSVINTGTGRQLRLPLDLVACHSPPSRANRGKIDYGLGTIGELRDGSRGSKRAHPRVVGHQVRCEVECAGDRIGPLDGDDGRLRLSGDGR